MIPDYANKASLLKRANNQGIGSMFTKSHGYAVRALLKIAELCDDPEKRVMASELAEATGIPASFLSKVLQQLTAAGLLDSARGRNGGVRPAYSPDEITLYEVAKVTDNNPPVGDLPPGWEGANPEVQKSIAKHWAPYKLCMLEFLGETSIGTLLREVKGGKRIPV